MIQLKTDEYRQLIYIMYTTDNLNKYINTDVIKYKKLNDINLKYLKSRMNRVTELITKIENDEN